jgi:hypothetical protein
MSRSKYGAVATTVDNVRFASKREAHRYAELKLLLKAGEIHDLEMQYRYPIRSVMRGGGTQEICVYVADFRYREGPTGILRVEDVKGVKTAVYKLKKRFVEAQYGIEIHEI